MHVSFFLVLFLYVTELMISQNIVQSMRDPKIAAFWLITMPQIVGGFNYDEDVKQKIWWAYKVSLTLQVHECSF